jgi:sec-independent protein translocase protein TatB
MMGISMQEFLLIALVALVFIGPRELPGMMRTIARGFGMAQRAAREFHVQLDRMVRESELADLHRDIEGLGQATPRAASGSPQAAPAAGVEDPGASRPPRADQGHPLATTGTDPSQTDDTHGRRAGRG